MPVCCQRLINNQKYLNDKVLYQDHTSSPPPNQCICVSNIHLLRKCAFLQKEEASIASFHHISQLGKVIKLNGSRFFLNNLIGWTNTELSSEQDATVLRITKITHAEARIS